MAERKSRSFVEQRRLTIMNIIKGEGRASVADLAERLGISQLTVRRDLDQLEGQGLVQRRYGEAVLADAEAADAGKDLLTPCRAVREAIAQAAAQLVEDHDLLFINTSSTALSVLSYLDAQGVTVVTNSAKARSLPIPPNGMTLVTGGEIRPPRGVLSGEFALNNIRSVAASMCLVGCAGITLGAGVTSTTQQEATVNSLMVERSDRMILLAGSNKLGIGAGFSYAPLDKVTLLITDTGATDEDVEILLDAGIHEIRRVEPLALG